MEPHSLLPSHPPALFLLQDSRHLVGDCMMWWSQGGNGYTSDLGKAQTYTRDEAASMNYTELLEHSFSRECDPTRLGFLSVNVFDFTTYSNDMDVFFGRKAVEVCDAITHRTTFKYIEELENHQWYLMICNSVFFEGRLNWGGSIRGAWWDLKEDRRSINTCGLWDGQKQLVDKDKLTFGSTEEWQTFIKAVIEFAAPEMQSSITTPAT